MHSSIVRVSCVVKSGGANAYLLQEERGVIFHLQSCFIAFSRIVYG